MVLATALLFTLTGDCLATVVPTELRDGLSKRDVLGVMRAYVSEAQAKTVRSMEPSFRPAQIFEGHACRFAALVQWNEPEDPTRLIATLYDRDYPHVPIPPAVIVYDSSQAIDSIRTAAIKLNSLIGSRLTFVPEIQAPASVPPPPSIEDREFGWNRKSVAWTSTALAVASLGAVIFFWIHTARQHQQQRRLCPDGRCSSSVYEQALELQSSGENAEMWRNVFLGTTSVLGVGAAALFTFDELDVLF